MSALQAPLTWGTDPGGFQSTRRGRLRVFGGENLALGHSKVASTTSRVDPAQELPL
jgi:hypothetical protein